MAWKDKRRKIRGASLHGVDAGEAHVAETSVRFCARDGYELAATLYEPIDPGTVACMLIVPGGGLSAGLYRHMARFMASHGRPTLVFDFRGMGKSRPASLRGFHAKMEDWAEFDTAAAIGWLRQRFPRLPMVAIAHSFGGTLLLGAPGTEHCSAIVFLSPHTGYWGDYRRRYRLPMVLLWHVLMPAATHLFGYFPGRALRLGGDMPAGFALQWAARRQPGYRLHGSPADFARGRTVIERIATTRVRSLVVSVSDDAFATESGIERFLATAPNLAVERWHVTPAGAQCSRIGHAGFFSRRMRPTLWQALLERLQRET